MQPSRKEVLAVNRPHRLGLPPRGFPLFRGPSSPAFPWTFSTSVPSISLQLPGARSDLTIAFGLELTWDPSRHTGNSIVQLTKLKLLDGHETSWAMPFTHISPKSVNTTQGTRNTCLHRPCLHDMPETARSTSRWILVGLRHGLCALFLVSLGVGSLCREGRSRRVEWHIVVRFGTASVICRIFQFLLSSVESVLCIGL